MRCPYCESSETKVTDSRDSGRYSIRRRRECIDCGRRFTTYEKVELTPVYVIKKDGRREKFNRNKLKAGVVKALEKRPIEFEQIEVLLDDIEVMVREMGRREVTSTAIGEFTMEELKKLDEVAYIRFASVYRSFADITSFEKELKKLIGSKESKEIEVKK